MTARTLLDKFGPRESMAYDVVIVGAGAAGLSTAIHLKQLAARNSSTLSVVVLEKGSEVGAHIVSGAIMDPKALSELFSDWQVRGAPLLQAVTTDELIFLGSSKAWKTPDFFIPQALRNQGSYIVSLSNLVRWLGQQAEALGVDIFPGFSAAEVFYNDDGSVGGVVTGDMGIAKDGEPTEDFQLGMALHGKYTVFAEGSRGHLGRQLIEKFNLGAAADPQTYALGIKEVWELESCKARPGHVTHTLGWPMDRHTYGGGFIYHLAANQLAIGFITGLDYTNPRLSPFEEMQRWKTHPLIRDLLEGAKRISFGARSITSGGMASLPRTVFPGGVLVGCEAGYLDFARIKGSHAAIKTGMLAAAAAFEAISGGRQHDELAEYPLAFRGSWLYEELQSSRNTKQWMKKGLYVSSLMNGIELWLLPKLGVRTPPWSIHNAIADHTRLLSATESHSVDYPAPDGRLTFDRPSSVFLTGTHHKEDQPSHLLLKNPHAPVAINWERYSGPEALYCPAGVYEFLPSSAGTKYLQINAQNCIHCKTCDIKDPTQNIVWVPPEGGGGPNYGSM